MLSCREIVVDASNDDGISTLGDPTFYPGAAPFMNSEENTAENSARQVDDGLTLWIHFAADADNILCCLI
jgi:hypothetical protein